MNGDKTDLRGTWMQAVCSLVVPVLLVLVFRWLLIEPFVIPSESMVPNLQIHDHILVNKLKYGIKIPFMDRWILMWSQPRRGDIVVFKYPENPNTYFVKRLIGVPGDHIEVSSRGLKVNGHELEHRELGVPGSIENGSLAFTEINENNEYTVQFELEQSSPGVQEINVPPGMYFMMGDNRDHSNDSRYWGFVKADFLVGPARFIWLSCEQMLESQPHVCDPSTIRWKRIGTLL
ncbi:MAG TPA: signal peptidase I [Pseudobdellovibrionaceae bacterium]|nr:signal peptidase I [Pseudobdellovibrionaceae bacterium]